MLFATGNNKNRFLKIPFKDADFVENEAICVVNKDTTKNMREITANFLKHNPNIMTYSILTNEQKELISLGVPL